MELMGEVLQETLLNDKPFWLCPSCKQLKTGFARRGLKTGFLL